MRIIIVEHCKIALEVWDVDKLNGDDPCCGSFYRPEHSMFSALLDRRFRDVSLFWYEKAVWVFAGVKGYLGDWKASTLTVATVPITNTWHPPLALVWL